MPAPKIDSYRFGRIVVDGQAYQRDVILLPDQVISDWWRQEGHALRAADLQAVIAARPQVLVVGQGAFSQMRVTSEARQALQEAGIELLALPTEQACQAYNELRQEKAAGAALHLTC